MTIIPSLRDPRRDAMARIRWLHVINGSHILLTFDNGETHRVDVKAILGEATFHKTFPGQEVFASMRIERTGGIIWESGFTIGGTTLHENAVQQAMRSK